MLNRNQCGDVDENLVYVMEIPRSRLYLVGREEVRGFH
jgi:hypothetical protein